MNKGLPVLLIALAAPFAAVTPAFGQSALQVSVAVGGNASNVAAGGSVAVTAGDIGQAVLATVTVRYGGSSTAIVTGVSLAGSSEFTTSIPLAVPLTLTPGSSATFVIQYLPASGTAVATQVAIAYTENSQASSFRFGLTGNSARLTFSYFVAPAGALTNVNSGDSITFPAVNVGATGTVVVNVLNRGTAVGALQSVTLSGAAFQLTGSPAPTQLQPNQQASFNVVFTPQATGGNQGLLTLVLTNSTVTFVLVGTGASPDLSVSYALADGNVRSLVDGAVIGFPSTDINGTATASITILNQGSGTGTVTGISVSGSAFRLNGSPLLPAAIPSGQSLKFAFVFAPTQTGTFSGNFRIDLAGRSVSGTLTGSTNPPNFGVTYTLADGIARPLSGGTIITFPSADVNATTTATIVILNQGTGAGVVTGIALAGAGFQLNGVPQLPATVAAGQSLRFGIVFAPTQAGTFSGTFRIDLGGTSISGGVTATTTTPNLTATYTLADGIVHPLPDGAAITFPPIDFATTSTAAIAIVNQGTGPGTVTGVSLSGSAFRLTGLVVLPAIIPAGQALRFGIVFAPSQSGSFSGTFRVDLGGSSISATLSATTAPANFTLAYVDPDTNSVRPLPDGSTVSFPNTQTGASSSITFVATNTGTGTGTIDAIALGSSSADAFQLLNLPSLPASVAPTQQVRVAVRFSPQQQQAFSAALLITASGKSQTVNLQATGIGPQFTYSYSSGTSTIVSPGGTVAIADTGVGQTTSVTFSILNSGTGDGQIPAISVTGQGLSLTDLPTLPFTLHANGAQRFTLNFAPTQPGAINGRLTIGSDTFTVTGTGIGSRLVYTYVNAALSTPVVDGGTVIFTPAAVGSGNSVDFTVQNTGTSGATISSINLAAASTVFALQNVPSLPFTLNPGATVTFTLGFAPNNTGGLTATMRINSSSFTLSGTGTQPQAIPAYQFQTPSGAPQPALQLPVGLTFSSSYPLALQGTLALSFVSSVFTDDPAIQFASGGRTVNFTIPANSTQAVFSGGSTTIPLQTGTTAGNIVITPSFAMRGGFDMTPSSPATLTLAIPRLAPQLSSASISAETTTSFTVILNGYSTTRALRQLDIQIAPKTGGNVGTSHLTIDVTSASSAWFQSAASQAFGGTFLIAIPFTLQNGSSGADLVHLIQSLSITATNEVGTSSALSVSIP